MSIMCFPWRRASVNVSAVILLATLAACTQTPHPGKSRPVAVHPVSNSDQVADVLTALDTGDVKHARKLLKAVAKRDKNDARVRILTTSIDGDPTKLLGSRSFAYTVQRGDSMGSLAQRFTGDRRNLFLLARYNGLKSGAIAAGQILRIPGSAPLPPPPPPQAAPPPRQREEPKATPQPIRPAQHPTTPVVVTPKANTAAAAALRSQAIKSLDQGRVATAVLLLRQARTLDPSNAAIQRDLARAERVRTAVKARK